MMATFFVGKVAIIHITLGDVYNVSWHEQRQASYTSLERRLLRFLCSLCDSLAMNILHFCEQP